MTNTKGPDEAWCRKRKDGSWDWSFDPPVKRHELKFTRLVRADDVDELRERLAKAEELLGARVLTNAEMDEAAGYPLDHTLMRRWTKAVTP